MLDFSENRIKKMVVQLSTHLKKLEEENIGVNLHNFGLNSNFLICKNKKN